MLNEVSVMRSHGLVFAVFYELKIKVLSKGIETHVQVAWKIGVFVFFENAKMQVLN
jgi:hypothetical protein